MQRTCTCIPDGALRGPEVQTHYIDSTTFSYKWFFGRWPMAPGKQKGLSGKVCRHAWKSLGRKRESVQGDN